MGDASGVSGPKLRSASPDVRLVFSVCLSELFSAYISTLKLLRSSNLALLRLFIWFSRPSQSTLCSFSACFRKCQDNCTCINHGLDNQPPGLVMEHRPRWVRNSFGTSGFTVLLSSSLSDPDVTFRVSQFLYSASFSLAISNPPVNCDVFNICGPQIPPRLPSIPPLRP